MPSNDFLDSISESSRPEPNAKGSFDCQVCYEPVDEAHYDRQAMTLKWWCQDGHESVIKEIEL